MSKTLESGTDKIQKICDTLRKETLEPAKKEAERLIAEAKHHAEKIVNESRKEAEAMIVRAKEIIENDRKLFHSALNQASKLTLETLKQSIEKELFNQPLAQIVQEQSADPALITHLIKSIIIALEKEGITADISAMIPRTLTTESVNALLGEKIVQRLKEGSVVLGDFDGGAQVKLANQKMTLDITDITLKELLSNFVRKDFRKMLFKS